MRQAVPAFRRRTRPTRDETARQAAASTVDGAQCRSLGPTKVIAKTASPGSFSGDMIPKSALVSCFFLGLILNTATAMEKDGLRVEVEPKILSDGSAFPSSFQLTSKVDQDMALKAAFKNISMKDVPEGTIEYVVLVRHWPGESDKLSVYRGTQKLPALRFGEEISVDIGKYHLGGHMHGTLDKHKDKVAGWKIVVTQGGKNIEFCTPTDFASLERTAKSAH
jgi:hypothetical protein